jgi:hypothetical protein
MTTVTLKTKIDGVEYNVHLVSNRGVWVRVVRVKDDGSTVDAFLSSRQWKKEAQVKRRFEKEIAAHIAS